MEQKRKRQAFQGLAAALCVVSVCGGLTGCGKKAPDAVMLQQSAYMLRECRCKADLHFLGFCGG